MRKPNTKQVELLRRIARRQVRWNPQTGENMDVDRRSLDALMRRGLTFWTERGGWVETDAGWKLLRTEGLI